MFSLQAAFLLPILQQLMADGVTASSFRELQEPEALIVAPTRELINQIYLEARKFAFGYAFLAFFIIIVLLFQITDIQLSFSYTNMFW